MLPILLTLTLLAPAAAPQKGAVLHKVPARPDPHGHYVIYLHGRIVEEQGPRPTHPDWGVYEYQKILDALAAPGLTVISEQRRPGTDMDQYAEHVAGQVRKLLAAKVPAEDIAVVGFSKGGGITTRASALLKNDKVNFVFLGACGNGDFSGSTLNVRGRILSIYEASDEIGRSCEQLFAKSKGAGERKEVKIETGKHHGAFFEPRKEWTDPLLAWIQ
jgi:hypothetical protein